jgi:hypothetical protein
MANIIDKATGAARDAIRKEAAAAVKPYVAVAIALALYAVWRTERRR